MDTLYVECFVIHRKTAEIPTKNWSKWFRYQQLGCSFDADFIPWTRGTNVRAGLRPTATQVSINNDYNDELYLHVATFSKTQ